MKISTVKNIANLYTMGCNAKCILYGSDDAENRRLLKWAQNRISQIVKIASFYRPDSEINQLPKGRYFPISRELVEMIRISQRYHKETQGYYDITLGAVKALWQQVRQTHQAPSKAKLHEAFQSSGMEKLEIDGNRLKINDSNLRLDLSEIAKGYAIDECISYLETTGSPGGMINIGGDIRVFGTEADQEGWRVGIQDTRRGKKSFGYITMTKGAVATSGNSMRHAVTGPRKLGHIVNPIKKGFCSGKDILSVTIQTDTCTDADILATAVFAMGVEKALAYLDQKSKNVKYLIITFQNKKFSFEKNMNINSFVL